MSDTLSMSMKVAIVVLLTGALLSTVLTISIPSLKFLTSQTEGYVKITNMSYNQLKGLKGEEMDSARIYRYIMEVEDKIGLIAVRENPQDQPNNYKVILCRERQAVTPAIQPHLASWDFNDLTKGYNEYSTYFGHDMVTEKFYVNVEVFPDGGLEIVCDLVIK